MDISTASLDFGSLEALGPAGTLRLEGKPAMLRSATPDSDYLRRVAWEIGERKAFESYVPQTNHVGLVMVHPVQGMAYWRLTHDWVEQARQSRESRWDGCRMVLRLYDVSFITFNGMNAHRIQDHTITDLAGQFFFNLSQPGTWQLVEVGFLLRDGEFVPGARSAPVPFAPDALSRHGGSAALLVQGGRVEPIGNVWDQEHILRERRQPRLRHSLRIAQLAFASRVSGQDDDLATFVSELALGQRQCGHDVHVFVPASAALPEDREVEGVRFHALGGIKGKTPIDLARSFARAAEKRLGEMPPFDLIHMHEWMTALGGWAAAHRPTVLSLRTIEATRRGDRSADELSSRIEALERESARKAGIVLTPNWLRDRAIAELGTETRRTHAFAMEGRLANEWEVPLDIGQVKMRFGIGPLDRLLLFVGPLEHAAGVDLLVEALPTVLRRYGSLRIGFIGNGPMQGNLERRAHEMGVAWAVRFLGHQGGQALTELLRASEALVLPSRYRSPMDDSVVDLARKAARAVVTTHGGPAHLVRHEENGLVTYDNPGSMVWAMDRVLGDPGHTQRMGENGRRAEGGTMRWSEVARLYPASERLRWSKILMSKGKTKHPPRVETPRAETPQQVIGRRIDEPAANGSITRPVALFCHEPQDSFIGRFVAEVAGGLARRNRRVTLFSRKPFTISGVITQAVGGSEDGDAIAQAKDFVSRAGNAYMQVVPVGQDADVLAFEWTAAGILPLLRGLRNQTGMLSLHSLERTRSDMTSELSNQINEIERESLDAASRVLVQEAKTSEQVRHWIPACAEKLVTLRERFPVEQFESKLDPGEVKARYQIGPIDPVLLFIGDLEERYGADLLVKAMPALLRHHNQARLVIVGEGPEQWPVRVFSRYLLLDYAVRVVGSVVDQPLRELIAASDVVCVPSREATPWWPILASWAARRPVVATHEAAKGLTEHEKDAVLVYPSENSVVWGVERVLYDADLRKAMGEIGRQKVEAKFGYDGVAEHIDELLTPAVK